MKKILIIVLFISVGFSQQKWNIKSMYDYKGLMYSPTSDKPYTGSVFSLDSLGTKKEEGKYRNGLKDGKWTQWHSNGQKSDEGTYKNGKKDGLWTEWHFTGSIYSEKTYRDGELIDEK